MHAFERHGAADSPWRALPLLGCAGFGSMFAMRMCDAMLPELARSFHATASEVAGAVSAFAIAYGVMQLVAGPLGDRFGKARIVALGALCCGLASLCAAAASSLAALTLGRTAMGAAAAGVIPLTMAWIGDAVPWESRQVVLARLLSYTVVGMMAGAWAGGLLSEVIGWRWAFIAVGVFLVGAAAAIRLNLAGGEPNPVGRAADYPSQVRSLLGDGQARRVYAVTLVEGALVFGVLAFIPSALHQRFGLSLTSAGAVLALFGAGGLIYARTAVHMLRRMSRTHLAVGGGILLCTAFVALAVMPAWWWGLPACLLAGFGFYLLHGTLQACATQLSATARGTAVSLFACALFLGQSLGISLMAYGFARDLVGPLTALAGTALLMLGTHFGARLRVGA